MKISLMLLIALIPTLIVWGVIIYVVYLLIIALRKYIKSEPVRKEKEEYAKTLGGVIKKHCMECQMTQEFVAETLGVSRQAVSKWENGSSDPSTTNLIALASLFDITPVEMLKEIR
ncbi:helix-turn-helix domain-containing protein [Catenibacterium sp.]|uniref:helix-turn-helix domain-containing protein n=1 Tax=Catenibacterium sp. TaxID=2049022 RepID=UPI003AB41089